MIGKILRQESFEELEESDMTIDQSNDIRGIGENSRNDLMGEIDETGSVSDHPSDIQVIAQYTEEKANLLSVLSRYIDFNKTTSDDENVRRNKRVRDDTLDSESD